MSRFTIWILLSCMFLLANSQDCPFGYYSSNGTNGNATCYECLTSCSGCTDLFGNCSGCSEGYKLEDDNSECVSCGLGVLTCDQNITCQPFYEQRLGSAHYCHPVCEGDCTNCESIFEPKCQNVTKSLRSQEIILMPEQIKNPLQINQTNSTDDENATNQTDSTDDENATNQTNSTGDEDATNQTDSTDGTANNGGSSGTNRLLQAPSASASMESCPIGQFLDNMECRNCSQICRTCKNSFDQCLECAEGYLKEGWKCITEIHFSEEVKLALQDGKEPTSENFEELKINMIQNALPEAYKNSTTDAISFKSIDLDDDNNYNIGIVVNRAGNMTQENVEEAKETFNRNLKSGVSLGPFQLAKQKVSEEEEEEEEDSKWWIAVAICMGLIVLFCCLAICCCCCCDKQKDDEYIDRQKYEAAEGRDTGRQSS